MKLIPMLAATAALAASAAFAQTIEPQLPLTSGVATPGGQLGDDAQAVYPADEVAAARRHFRAQCGRYEPAGTCECVTAGFAQTLAPNELRLAAADLPVRAAKSEPARVKAVAARDHAAAQLGFSSASDRTLALVRVQKLEAELAPLCSAPLPT